MKDTTLFELSGKKALVTGGAMGIGRACAKALAMGGADVAIIDINEELGHKTVESIKAMGVDALFVRCDVTDKTQVQQMVSTVVERFGRLDIAVNNAGLYIHGDDETQAQEDWDKVIGLNLTGTWLCCQAVAQQMIKQVPTEGKIINMASMAATISCSNGAYDASKAGVKHLTRTLAAQWGRYNINVNSISPGYVVASMGATSRPLDERQRIRALTPMGHMQRLEDLYGPIQFLASKASDFMTGQDLLVDSGHTLNTWLTPLTRDVPPRISPEVEVIEMNNDLDAMGVPHDKYGVRLSHKHNDESLITVKGKG